MVSDDGRVVDPSSADSRTVSEGQAYALFFALVANDRSGFDSLLSWTQNNLAQGDLTRHLPAWHWGRGANGWGVLDSNSASDADVLMVYTLAEAGRLWQTPSYTELAVRLGRLVLERESRWVKGLGLSLLPGHVGFVRNGDTGAEQVKLNPSYVPLFVMHRLAVLWPDEPAWASLAQGSLQLLLQSHQQGRFADWAVFENGLNLRLTAQAPGSYDAIRVYLWTALSAPLGAAAQWLRLACNPMLKAVQSAGVAPEQWNAHTGEWIASPGPSGFQWVWATLMPSAVTLNGLEPAEGLATAQAWRSYGYYNSALRLFAQGHLEGRYRIDAEGRLIVRRGRP